MKVELVDDSPRGLLMKVVSPWSRGTAEYRLVSDGDKHAVHILYRDQNQTEYHACLEVDLSQLGRTSQDDTPTSGA